MTIKRGVPLDQTGLLKPDDLRIAKAMSITTIEEFVAYVEGLSAQSHELFSHVKLDVALESASRLMAFPFSGSDVERAREQHAKRATGALPPIREVAERPAKLHTEDLQLTPGKPSDTPEVFLESCLGPIREQGDRGTCVAHAVVAMQECLEKKRTGDAIDLSEQFLYWLCKMNDGDPQGFGTWQRIAIPLAVELGICAEPVWPYNPTPTSGNESQGPPPDSDGAFDDADSHRPSRGVVHVSSDLDGLRERLKKGFPVGVSVPVFSNWGVYTVKLEGHIPMPPPRERPDSGHAMLMVGYGFDEGFLGGGYFIVRNSWGVDWATESPFGNGYGTLPFSYVGRYAWEVFSLE